MYIITCDRTDFYQQTAYMTFHKLLRNNIVTYLNGVSLNGAKSQDASSRGEWYHGDMVSLSFFISTFSDFMHEPFANTPTILLHLSRTI